MFFDIVHPYRVDTSSVIFVGTTTLVTFCSSVRILKDPSSACLAVIAELSACLSVYPKATCCVRISSKIALMCLLCMLEAIF